MKKTLLVVSALSVALASQAQILKPESVLGGGMITPVQYQECSLVMERVVCLIT